MKLRGEEVNIIPIGYEIEIRKPFKTGQYIQFSISDKLYHLAFLNDKKLKLKLMIISLYLQNQLKFSVKKKYNLNSRGKNPGIGIGIL